MSDLKIETGTTSPKEIWETRDQWVQGIKESQERFESLTDDKRAGLVRVVSDTCMRMATRADDWVPEGLTGNGGEYMEVTFRVMFTDIDAAISREDVCYCGCHTEDTNV